MIEVDEDELIDLLMGRSARPLLVGLLNEHHRAAIGSYSHMVWLSAYTAHKIYTKHRDTTLDLYKLAPTILRVGEARRFIAEPRELAFLYTRYAVPNKPLRAVVKTTRDGRENYLLSVYRIQKSQIGKTLSLTVKVGRGGASR